MKKCGKMIKSNMLAIVAKSVCGTLEGTLRKLRKIPWKLPQTITAKLMAGCM